MKFTSNQRKEHDAEKYIQWAIALSLTMRVPRNSPKIWTYSSSMSSKVTDLGAKGNCICNFPFVINSNFGRILPFSRYWRLKLESGLVTTPTLFVAPNRANQLEFLDATYSAKTRWVVLPYGKNCIILTSAIFDWSTVHRCDRQIDRRTGDSI